MVLAVWGSHDDYLPPKRSAAFLERCLDASGHRDLTCTIIPGAGHILTVPGRDDRFVAPYPDLLADWIARRFR